MVILQSPVGSAPRTPTAGGVGGATSANGEADDEVGSLEPMIQAGIFALKWLPSDALPALFGDVACAGERHVCEASFRARRFHMSNTLGPSIVLIGAAVAQTLLAFPREQRCQNRRSFYNGDELEDVRRATTASFVVSTIAVLGAIAAAWILSDATSAFASLEVSLLFVAIPLAWWGNSSLACAVHLSGQLIYTSAKLGSPFSYDLKYFTHWCLAATAVLLFLLAITTGVSRLFYLSCFSRGNFVEWIETTTAVCLIFVTSTQLLLTLLTLGLASGVDGALDDDYRSWAVYGLDFSCQHTISFFFCAALVGGRFEFHEQYIRSVVLKIVWFSGPLGLLLGWGLTALTTSGEPYSAMADFVVVLSCSLAAFVPWVIIGAVVC